MAGYIEDRWINKKKAPTSGKRERTARYGKGSRYRVAGIPGVRNMSFGTLEDAKAWLRRAGTDSERGEFVDPRDGSIALADYVTRFWKEGVRGAPGTIKRVDERVRLHILPYRPKPCRVDEPDRCRVRMARVAGGAARASIGDEPGSRSAERTRSLSWAAATRGA